MVDLSKAMTIDLEVELARRNRKRVEQVCMRFEHNLKKFGVLDRRVCFYRGSPGDKEREHNLYLNVTPSSLDRLHQVVADEGLVVETYSYGPHQNGSFGWEANI